MADLSTVPHNQYAERYSLPRLDSQISQQFKLSYLKNISVKHKSTSHNQIRNLKVNDISCEENVLYCFLRTCPVKALAFPMVFEKLYHIQSVGGTIQLRGKIDHKTLTDYCPDAIQRVAISFLFLHLLKYPTLLGKRTLKITLNNSQVRGSSPLQEKIILIRLNMRLRQKKKGLDLGCLLGK